ncbi:tyrosine-protein phosphatase RLPH2-like [Rosa chinensis]|uniref:tyrosine-protein phosphatase RLPH2-like n=1 Tax=Rosa chinensis TaxID=74649 RepID=UPI000D08EB02|nr:tyrosine-protein phosphatase RLPH2-like [Rosa chinensis]
MSDPKPRLVCCIGDVHGFHTKLQNLLSNLEISIPSSDFATALVIFLGEYCGRGPDTNEVLDFFVVLPSIYPRQRDVFIAGNHDLAFAAFLRVLPPPPDGSEFEDSEETRHQRRKPQTKRPDTNEVLDFFVVLPSIYRRQRDVFITGNHDLDVRETSLMCRG